MQIIDATPPDGFPAQVIVQHDRQFCERHPGEGYYLRVKLSETKVDGIRLTGAYTMVEARRMAESMGYTPTHWTLPGDGHPFMF